MNKPDLDRGRAIQYCFRDVVPGSNRKFGNCECICHRMPASHTVPCCGPGSPGYNPATDLPEEGVDVRSLFKMVPGGRSNK